MRLVERRSPVFFMSSCRLFYRTNLVHSLRCGSLRGLEIPLAFIGLLLDRFLGCAVRKYMGGVVSYFRKTAYLCKWYVKSHWQSF